MLFMYVDIYNSQIKYISTEAGDVNFGNNTMSAVPLKENPSNGNDHWSAYVMPTDKIGTDIVSVRVIIIIFIIIIIYFHDDKIFYLVYIHTD